MKKVNLQYWQIIFLLARGAKIIGALTVANHVKIGANAVLTKNADEGATMLGIPAKAYKKNNDEASN